MDPCEPKAENDAAIESEGLLLVGGTLRIPDFLIGESTTPMYSSHIVLRGTYVPGTVRCTTGNRFRYPSYRSSFYGSPAGGLVDVLLIYCFADMRVNTYLLGSGPSRLTMIVGSSLYAEPGDDDEDYGTEQLESRRLAYERALTVGGRFGFEKPLNGYLPPGGGQGPLRLQHHPPRLSATGPAGGIGGREVVMFVGPLYNTSIEAWNVYWTWEVKQRDDGTVVAHHPFSQSLNMELPALTQAIATVHQARVAANGGRIGEDDSLPMFETDANRLRQYFSDPKVGAYAAGVPTPAQPPPPCGLAVPDQADNPGLMRDCINLLAAKDALRGTATLNWSVGTPISDWDGVRVSGPPGRVTSLNLMSKNLTGTISPDLGRLGGLEHLRLNDNQLTGCIPPALRDVDDNDLDSLGLQDCATVAAPTPTPTPESAPVPTSVPTSVPTPTPLPVPSPGLSYLTEEIPTCTPVPGSHKDPCEPEVARATGHTSENLGLEPWTVRFYLGEGILVSHLVLRGTYLPGTVRCNGGEIHFVSRLTQAQVAGGPDG